MGKYMRKNKITCEVSVMVLPQSSSSSSSHQGVRTRAKTLALQKLQDMNNPNSSTETNSDNCYLQLRSRRLEKLPPIVSPNSPKKTTSTGGGKQKSSTNPRITTSIGKSSSKKKGNLSTKKGDPATTVVVKKEEEKEEDGASFGENSLEFETKDREARETTPCSLIRAPDTIASPGSTTRRRNSAARNRITQNAIRDLPPTIEVDDFFSGPEQEQQKEFKEKYNFDPVTDSPLPGRYEWVKLNP